MNVERSAMGLGSIGPDSYVLEYRADWNANVLVPATQVSMLRPMISAMRRSLRLFAR